MTWLLIIPTIIPCKQFSPEIPTSLRFFSTIRRPPPHFSCNGSSQPKKFPDVGSDQRGRFHNPVQKKASKSILYTRHPQNRRVNYPFPSKKVSREQSLRHPLWSTVHSESRDALLQHWCSLEDHHMVLPSELPQLQDFQREKERNSKNGRKYFLPPNGEFHFTHLLRGNLGKSKLLSPYSFCFLSSWQHQFLHTEGCEEPLYASKQRLEITLQSKSSW